MFSFDPALSSDRDWIRAALGDTDAATAILSDAQIDAVRAAELAQPGGSRETATWCCAAHAAAVITREPVKIGVITGESYDLSDRLLALRPLVQQWHALSVQRAAAPTPTAPHQPSMSIAAKAVW